MSEALKVAAGIVVGGGVGGFVGFWVAFAVVSWEPGAELEALFFTVGGAGVGALAGGVIASAL